MVVKLRAHRFYVYCGRAEIKVCKIGCGYARTLLLASIKLRSTAASFEFLSSTFQPHQSQIERQIKFVSQPFMVNIQNCPNCRQSCSNIYTMAANIFADENLPVKC